MLKNRPKVIDLFSGVGGLSLGAARAGFELALAVDSDPHAIKSHAVNFPNVKHSSADISKLDGESLLRLAGLKQGELDGLIGGPPCQGFSAMGHRKIEDSRNDLFVKFFQLVAECKPAFFLAENVLGIRDRRYDSLRQSAFDQVRDEYTLLDPMVLKASDYGAPTSRERVFFIGFRKDSNITLSVRDFEDAKTNYQVTVGEALKGLPWSAPLNWDRKK